ncbi:autotransporter-associated beta strand repeat-containing protein [Sphingorhabdus sp.]|jgi:autotransporter-associated beta strand protein|uniref:autotransporter-associated beta strand repeat-containing protein n=1 Tax=Sphingorhabdus sp. TaxID=1902408 RepID=UPI003BAE8A9C|nr:autotransporter-associated beta strand repeat-containing protein [Sphingomonadales bacterium]MBK9432364.1 autotransporter-associated beta strand repeat-containing protein [Sphingomonadales bacterium]MBL0022098.1 autotransporter-associated beta strand repeat-containing protein [Sphingomonadales bacterium]
MPSWIRPSDGLWDDLTNWSGGIPDAEGAIANFNFFNQTTALTVFVPNANTMSIGRLNINNSSAGMIFRGNGTSATNYSWLAFDQLPGSAAAVNHNSTGALTFSSEGALRLLLNDETIFNAASTGTISILCPIAGTGKLTKSGSGDLVMRGWSNTYSGGTQIEGGRVIVDRDVSLGTGFVSLTNDAALQLRFTSTLDQWVGTVSTGTTAPGSGRLLANTGAIITLTGTLSHAGGGTLTFGSATETGRIVVDTASFQYNATATSFRLAGGILEIGNQIIGTHMFRYAGAGTNTIESGAWLNTGGFTTFVSNLDLNGGAIYTSTGAMRFDATLADGAAQTGQITGTGFVDSASFSTDGNCDLSTLIFHSWTTSDTVAISGNSASNFLIGTAVNDKIRGNGGFDILRGGLGDDELIFSSNNGGSWADGGTGNDRITIFGSISLGAITGIEELNLPTGGNLTMSLAQFTSSMPSNLLLMGTGSLTISKSATDPTLNLGGLNFVAGSSVTININGSTATDIIKGSTRGSNTINSGDSNDQIRGGNLADTINGENGNDKIYGAGGSDTLTGGIGVDQFRYVFATDSGLGAAADRITDFLSGTDRLNFALMDADAVTAGDQAFNFVGTAAFANTGIGQIRYQNSGADLLVQADVNGDGVADMEIILQGQAGGTLTAGDFIL